MSDPREVARLRECARTAWFQAAVCDFSSIDMDDELEGILFRASGWLEPWQIAKALTQAAKVPGDRREFIDSLLDFLMEAYGG